MSVDLPSVAAPVSPFSSVVLLVCRDCRERSSGPKKLKAQEIAKALKQTLRLERPRPRVVTSSCIGLCPKRATAVACVGGQEARVAAVQKLRQIDGSMRLLGKPAATPV